VGRVGVYFSQVLVDGLVYLAWCMLFVVVAEVRLLIVELNGFGLWWRRKDRIDSRTKVVLAILMGAPILSAIMGMKGNIVQMMVAIRSCMVDFFCQGLGWRLILFWPLRKWDNLLFCDLYHFHDTCNTMTCFGFARGPIPGLCVLHSGCGNLSWY
jgi:hypothetical protein